jgi:hypothetical protein
MRCIIGTVASIAFFRCCSLYRTIYKPRRRRFHPHYAFCRSWRAVRCASLFAPLIYMLSRSPATPTVQRVFHAHHVASARSHASHAGYGRCVAPKQRQRGPRGPNAALRAARISFSRCFPLRPSLSTPTHLASWGSHTTSAYLRIQSRTTPRDPFTSTNNTRQCPCGAPLTSAHFFFECLLLVQARAELPSSNKDIRFDPDMVAHVVSFLRKTGVGFSCYPKQQVLEPDPTDESIDEEVGPVIGNMLLDLAI